MSKRWLFSRGESEDNQAITTPFNIEAILASCPKLYEKWIEHPFYFDLDEKGKVIVRYVEVEE